MNGIYTQYSTLVQQKCRISYEVRSSYHEDSPAQSKNTLLASKLKQTKPKSKCLGKIQCRPTAPTVSGI